MGVPEDRRVILGAHVVPQLASNTTSTEVEREEGTKAGVAAYARWGLDTTVAKRFGGKGSVTITANQGDDDWVSFFSPIDDTWDSRSEADDKWEDTFVVWDRGALYVDNTLVRLVSHSTAIKFLYIKNLGSIECEVALEGDERDILIPPGAAVAMRTTSTVTCATVKVATAASSGNTTTIEYVVGI